MTTITLLSILRTSHWNRTMKVTANSPLPHKGRAGILGLLAAQALSGLIVAILAFAVPAHAQDADCMEANCQNRVGGGAGGNSTTSHVEIGRNVEQDAAGNNDGALFRISVDGEPVSGAALPEDMARKTDLALEAVDIQVKFDGLEVKPILNVSTAPIRKTYKAGERIEFLASLNYPDWIVAAELRIHEQGREGSETPLHVVPFGKNLVEGWTMPEEGPADLSYVLRVYDAEGRFDETRPRFLTRTVKDFEQHEPRDASVAPGYGEDFTALRNIPVYGGAVTVHGRNVPDANHVMVLGDAVPVDADGAFVIQRILPPGDHDVAVLVGDDGGKGLSFNRKINIPSSDWFYVALADLTVGGRLGSDHIEDVKAGEFDKIYGKGRLAFYLKGKIRGRYLLTASADTGEDRLKNLFKGLDAKDPRQFLRRLDPNAYYPVYGDDSTAMEDAPTRGKFYIRLERGDSHAMWGNFKTRVTGTQFLRNERALYGASAVYRSESATPNGERRTEASAYAAQPGTLPQRDVLRGTGGSAYFLKQQDVTPGSETVTVEIRDRVSGQVQERRRLRYGHDYDMNYVQGLVLLHQPLSSSTAAGGVVRADALGGNDVFLVVAYEYTPAAADVDGYVYGGRAQQWIGAHVRAGVTGMSEKTGPADQILLGADVTVHKSDRTYLEAEIAQTKGPGFGNSFSADGGLTIADQATAGLKGKTANAYRIKLRGDAAELTGGAVKGDIEAYYERKQGGFSSLDEQVTDSQLVRGANGNVELSRRTEIGAGYVEKRVDGGKSNLAIDAHATYHLNDVWSISSGIRHERKKDPAATASDVGTRTDVGAKVAYQLSEDRTLYGFGMATVGRTRKRGRNDRAGIGGEAKLSEKIDLSAEGSYGVTGIGGQARLGYSPTADDHYYAGYRIDPDRAFASGPSSALTGDDLGVIVAGARHRYSDRLSMFAEESYDMFGLRRALTQTYGVDYTPDARWVLSGGLEIGSIVDDSINASTGLKNSDFDRKALSVSALYRGENGMSGKLKGEVRFEDSEDGTRDRTSYLFGAGLTFALSDNWNLQTNLDAVISDASQSTLDGDYIEGSIGYAYRPVDNDRLNALFRYTYLYDLPGIDQVTIDGTTEGPRQMTHILSADVSYDIVKYLTIGAKYGFRIGEIAPRGGGGWEAAAAHLGIVRADLHIVKSWDVLLEGRALRIEDAGSTDWGALIAVYRQIDENFKIGVGYNIGRFSDDLRDQTYDDQGVFINAVGQF